ncbi:MAG: hypothetical protein ABSG88_04465 [Bradyrhizobium sp.]
MPSPWAHGRDAPAAIEAGPKSVSVKLPGKNPSAGRGAPGWAAAS